ncbi:histidine phosphatase family protein [Actinokineospora sp. 24-640]
MIAHQPTAATRLAAFPADETIDEPFEARAPRVDAALRGPETRCADTAAWLGLDAERDQALRDLDAGSWRGQPLSRVQLADPEGLASWLGDPSAPAPGGESVADVVARVGAWLDTRPAAPRRVAAITHPAVLRASLVHVLRAPASAFWRIDVAPGARIVLRGGAERWTALFR